MKRPLGVITTIALLLAVVGVSAGHEADAVEPPGGDLQTLKVVLVGDSYSAGNGARDANGDSQYFGPSPCHRSHANWSERYVAWLTAQGYHVTFLNRACSDGVAKDLIQPRDMDDTDLWTVAAPGSDAELLAQVQAEDRCNTGAYPDEEYWTYKVVGPDGLGGRYVSCSRYLRPQTDAIGPDTDLVLFTMGGNDIRFSDIVKQCFAAGFRSPGDCRKAVNYARDHFSGAMDGVQTALDQMRANGLREDARVVYLGYPLLAQDNGYDLTSWFGLGNDNYKVADEVRALGLEGNTQQAAMVADDNLSHPGQVTFIDNVPDYFEGHEPDGSATNRNPDRWINEFFEPSKTDQREWYHPNYYGHEAYKDLLVQASPLFNGGLDPATGDIDIVFTIDTTGSMGGYIAQVKQYAEAIVDQVQAQTNSARFALVTYRDEPAWTGESVDYPARVDHDFTTDSTALKSAIDAVTVNGGGDWPETMYSGIDAALDLPWRPGVKKVVIVLADAPPHDPEPISGLTGQDIIDHALAVDPAEVYVVDTGSAVDASLDRVITETGGSSVNALSSTDVPGALLELLQAAIDKPYAWINGPYTSTVGRPVTLDGSGSYATSGSVASYGWDYDSDGTIDETTSVPVVTHAWAERYFGFVTLTVTDTEGRSTIATTHVGITDDGDEEPRATDNCPDVANMGQDDFDGDGVGDACDDTSGWPTEDREGVSEGFGETWPFGGFVAPVAGAPAVNHAQAGRTVPVKFVLADHGLDIFASGSPSYVEVGCATLEPVPGATPRAVVLSGASKLRYASSTSQYSFSWATARNLAGSCYRLDLALVDGSTHSAIFQME